MDAFDEIEEQIRRQENKVEAEKLKQRLAELENELTETPVQPRVKHVEIAETSSKKSISKQMADVGKFCLIVVSVIVAIRVAAWIGTIVMVLGVTWMAYKLFLESK